MQTLNNNIAITGIYHVFSDQNADFRINEKLLQLAVTPAQDDDEDGVDFSFDDSSREVPIAVKEPAVLNTVKKLVSLEKEGQTIQLVLKGTVYLEERTIIYDLTEAEAVAVKPRGRRKKTEQ